MIAPRCGQSSCDEELIWTAERRLHVPEQKHAGRGIDDQPRVSSRRDELPRLPREQFLHALLANDLVDAMSIFTVPVVLGGGKKLFADGSAPHSYKLTRSRVSSMGLVIAHYERAGEIKIGDTALDSPSDAERARQERMKREG